MILCVSLNPAIDKMLKIDEITIGGVSRARIESVHAGGKAINVASNLLLQGDSVKVTGYVGGRAGMQIIEELKKRHLPFDFIRLGTETRTNMNYIDSQGRVTEILESGHLVDAKSEEEFKHLYHKLVKDADMVVLSGSLPIGLGNDTYADMCVTAAREGVPVCLDTSGEALKQAVECAPFLIKPNLNEFEYLTGRTYDFSLFDEDIKAFFESDEFKTGILREFRRLRKKGIMIVCLTLGKRGALIYVKDEIIYVSAPEVDVINTVGSGDCMLASLIHSLVKNADIKEACRYAIAVSSAHVTTMNVAEVDPQVVNDLIKKVKMHVVKVIAD
jgi:1-phosphofructokinase family hexose kinase